MTSIFGHALMTPLIMTSQNYAKRTIMKLTSLESLILNVFINKGLSIQQLSVLKPEIKFLFLPELKSFCLKKRIRRINIKTLKGSIVKRGKKS